MNFKIFTNTKEQELASGIVKSLFPKVRGLGKCRIDTFNDGEKSPQFEESIRGMQVFLIGSTSVDIMELLLMIDAAKRASAGEIIAVVPYYGYARQDRKDGPRGAIGAKLVADLLTTAGANRIVTIDLHAAQIQGFFNIPVDHIEGHTVFIPYLKNQISTGVICSPDAGGFQRASKFAQKLELPIVTINKRRDKPGSISSMELVGDVTGKSVVIVDDMVDTAGTLCKAADYLKEKGATYVYAVCTHPVLSNPAIERISNNKSLMQLVVSDSIPLTEEGKACSKIRVVSAAGVIAETIGRIVSKKSINEINLASADV